MIPGVGWVQAKASLRAKPKPVLFLSSPFSYIFALSISLWASFIFEALESCTAHGIKYMLSECSSNFNKKITMIGYNFRLIDHRTQRDSGLYPKCPQLSQTHRSETKRPLCLSLEVGLASFLTSWAIRIVLDPLCLLSFIAPSYCTAFCLLSSRGPSGLPCVSQCPVVQH